jgi:hypothetical protein
MLSPAVLCDLQWLSNNNRLPPVAHNYCPKAHTQLRVAIRQTSDFWRFPAGGLEAAAKTVRNMYQMRALSAQKRTKIGRISLIPLVIRAKAWYPTPFSSDLIGISTFKTEFVAGSIPDCERAFSQNGHVADEKGILKRRFVWLLVEKEAKCLKSR